MISQKEIDECEEIHKNMMSKVEHQVAAAKEARFRFMSPVKLFSKLKESSDKNMLRSFERDLRSISGLQNPSLSFHKLNPLEESVFLNSDSENSSDNDIIQLQRIEQVKSSRNRRNLNKNNFFKSI